MANEIFHRVCKNKMYIKMDFTSVDRFDGEALHKMNRGMNTILNIDNTRSIT